MNQNKELKNFLLVFIIFLTSFLLGYISKESLIIKEKVFNNENYSQSFSQNNVKMLKDNNLDLSLFWQAYSIIKNNYFEKENIDNSEIQKHLITWLTESLWDKFSEYMDIETQEKFTNLLSWDFEWIWAVIKKHELWVSIDSLIKWSPALKWWLLKWDIIIKANGTVLEWMETVEAVSYIKGPADSVVKLEIIREWENSILEKEIIRKKIIIPSVDTQDIESDSIWYISLNIFWEHTNDEFSEILEEYKNDDKIKWIIIDLRDNWWWLLNQAVDILSNFVEDDKVLVTTKFPNQFLNKSYRSNNIDWIVDKKIIILINGSSASASEIVAWALKDYNKAILVWEKTYWKWSVQQPFYLDDWSLLKLTIAKWYTPSDISIDHNWIEPDLEVNFKKSDYTPEAGKEDEFKFYDRQLETAKELMNYYIETDNIWLALEKYKEEQN